MTSDTYCSNIPTYPLSAPASVLQDSDPEVRCSVEAALGAIFTKCRSTLPAYFVELIFVLSGCRSSNKAGSSHDSGLPSLAVASPSRRAGTYSYLLSIMSDEQRLSVHGKLASEVLGGIIDGSLTLRGSIMSLSDAGKGVEPNRLADASQLLIDTLALLGSAEMRTSTTVGVPLGDHASSQAGAVGDDDDAANAMLLEEGAGSAQSGDLGFLPSVNAAKAKILAKLVRKAVVENVVPLVLGVRAVLLRMRSALLMGALLDYLGVLIEDHGDDVKGECVCIAPHMPSCMLRYMISFAHLLLTSLPSQIHRCLGL